MFYVPLYINGKLDKKYYINIDPYYQQLGVEMQKLGYKFRLEHDTIANLVAMDAKKYDKDGMVTDLYCRLVKPDKWEIYVEIEDIIISIQNKLEI